MTTKHIQKLNEAVYILRNFVELSSQLLPFLLELKYLKKPTKEDIIDKENIIDLFNNYAFDNITSVKLMDSPILSLINDSFVSIMEDSKTKRNANKKLRAFFKEHDRLKKNWKLIDAN